MAKFLVRCVTDEFGQEQVDVVEAPVSSMNAVLMTAYGDTAATRHLFVYDASGDVYQVDRYMNFSTLYTEENPFGAGVMAFDFKSQGLVCVLDTATSHFNVFQSYDSGGFSGSSDSVVLNDSLTMDEVVNTTQCWKTNTILLVPEYYKDSGGGIDLQYGYITVALTGSPGSYVLTFGKGGTAPPVRDGEKTHMAFFTLAQANGIPSLAVLIRDSVSGKSRIFRTSY